MDLFDADTGGQTDFATLLEMGHLQLWATPSMQYLAIERCHPLVTSIRDGGLAAEARAYARSAVVRVTQVEQQPHNSRRVTAVVHLCHLAVVRVP